MKNKSFWIAALLLGSALAFSPAANAAEKDMMKDAKGAKDAKGMMKDEKGMKQGKDAMSKDKMKAEKTGKAMADDMMKKTDKMKDDKMKMDSKKN